MITDSELNTLAYACLAMQRKTKVTVAEGAMYAYVEGNCGVCVECGEWTSGGVEPDAEKDKCTVCSKMAVYGAEQALLMGLIELGE